MNEAGMELQRHAADTWQVIRNRIGLIFLSFLLVFSVAAIVTYIMPRKYLGRVQMKIERMVNKLPVFNRDNMDQPMLASDTIIKTEYETITKLETLYPVIDSFELMKRWNTPSRQDAVNKLRKNLDTQSSVRSDFVVIEYYDEDPKLAADIANAIADSYMQKRVEIDTNQKNEALAVIKKQIAESEQRHEEARMKMQAARTKAGVVGDGFYQPGNSLNMPSGIVTTPEESLILAGRQELLRQDLEVQKLESEINELGKLTDDQLVDRAIGLRLDSPELAVLMAEQNKNTQQRESLSKAGLGPRHPTVASLEAAISEGRKQLKQRAIDYRDGLKTRLATALQSREKLMKSSDLARAEILGKQSTHNDYQDARNELDTINNNLLQMRMRYAESELSITQAKSAATIWEKAEPQSAPAKPNVALNLALGGVFGLMFGFGLAFLLEYMDTTVKTLEEVEKFLGVPVLAVVPKDVGILHRASGFNPDAEAYRILRTNIEFNRRDPNANCLTVVSGGAGEGKSTTLSNLAFVCAQGGYNVLLIDGDLRRPRLHTLFDVSNAVGLTNYLTTNVRLEEVVIQTAVENLYFLPSGILPADSAGILNSQRMSELITDVKSRFDLVLIDSPPILGVSDASVLANEADMTIIVVQHRKLPRQMLLRVKQAIENVGGNVLGVVLNNVDVRSDTSYQYYTSYYTYYSPTNGAPPRKKERRKETKSHIVKPDRVTSAVTAANATRNPKNEDLF